MLQHNMEPVHVTIHDSSREYFVFAIHLLEKWRQSQESETLTATKTAITIVLLKR